MEKIKTWHISILVVMVSVLSVLLLTQYVSAAWTDPSQAPVSTSASNVVVTPMTANLDLNGSNLVDTDFVIDPNGNSGFGTASPNAAYKLDVVGNLNATQLCIAGNCEATWPAGLWTASGLKIYYNLGNVGIGTSNPNKLLHVKSGDGINAEIDLQAGGIDGDNSHWGIYHDNDATPTDDLRFWKDNADRVTFTDNGKVGIGPLAINPGAFLDVHPPDNAGDNPSATTALIRAIGWQNSLYGSVADTDGADGGPIDFRFGATEADTGLNLFKLGFTIRDETNGANRFFISAAGTVGINTIEPDSSYKLHSYSATASAIYGQGASLAGSKGVYGTGYYGVKGEGTYGLWGQGSTGGAGIRAVKGTSMLAGEFDGTVKITNGYMQLPTGTSAPAAADCDSDFESGYMLYNYSTNKLYICDGATEGWNTLDAPNN